MKQNGMDEGYGETNYVKRRRSRAFPNLPQELESLRLKLWEYNPQSEDESQTL